VQINHKGYLAMVTDIQALRIQQHFLAFEAHSSKKVAHNDLGLV